MTSTQPAGFTEARSPATSPRDLVVMVERIAARLARRLPAQVDRDDLVGAGLVGLATALQRFDPARSANLAAFAEHRIRGEMLDELRRMDPLSRDARDAVRRRQRIIDSRSSRGLDIGPEQIANELGASLPTLHAIEREAAHDRTVPLDGHEPADARPDPFEQASLRELGAQLAAVLERLPASHRLILRLRYLEDRPLREIGERLGVTASRVCQLHSEALHNLRAKLAGRLALAA